MLITKESVLNLKEIFVYINFVSTFKLLAATKTIV